MQNVVNNFVYYSFVRQALYSLYRLLTHCLTPLLPYWSQHRLRRGKEDATRWREKLGDYTPIGYGTQRPLWFHAVSVGEFYAALPLIEHLHTQYPIVVTTNTHSSAQLAHTHLPPQVVHAYAPWDTPAAIRAFFTVHRPRMGIFIDSELWPNMLHMAQAARIPLLLLNGRMSAPSLHKRLRIKSLYQSCLRCFSGIFTADIDTARRFKTLGARNVVVVGSVKEIPRIVSYNTALVKTLRLRMPWVGMSLHRSDLNFVLAMAAQLPQRLCILVPRHIEHATAWQHYAEQQGFLVQKRSDSALPHPDTQIYIANTFGESALWYAAADAAYIGKSTTAQEGGGHNPIEALRGQCVPLHGAYVENFSREYTALNACGASILVHTPSHAVAQLNNRMHLQHAQHAGQQWLQQQPNPLPLITHVIARLWARD